MTVASKCRVDVPAGYSAKCMIAACRDAELVPEIFGTFAPSAARFEREKSRRPTYVTKYAQVTKCH